MTRSKLLDLIKSLGDTSKMTVQAIHAAIGGNEAGWIHSVYRVVRAHDIPHAPGNSKRLIRNLGNTSGLTVREIHAAIGGDAVYNVATVRNRVKQDGIPHTACKSKLTSLINGLGDTSAKTVHEIHTAIGGVRVCSYPDLLSFLKKNNIPHGPLGHGAYCKKILPPLINALGDTSSMTTGEIHAAIGGEKVCPVGHLRTYVYRKGLPYAKRTQSDPVSELRLLRVLDVSELTAKKIHKLLGGDKITSLDHVQAFLSQNKISYKHRKIISRGTVASRLAEIGNTAKYTAPELCAKTGIKYDTMRAYLEKNSIPYKKVPRNISKNNPSGRPSRLSVTQKIEIRAKNKTMNMTTLAAEYGVSRSTIRAALTKPVNKKG
jgi:arsenate reductase-like glutaredoxin family protein